MAILVPAHRRRLNEHMRTTQRYPIVSSAAPRVQRLPALFALQDVFKRMLKDSTPLQHSLLT